MTSPPVPESAPLTPEEINAFRSLMKGPNPDPTSAVIQKIDALCDMALRCGSATADARVNDAKFQGATGACAHFITERDRAYQRISQLEAELATATQVSAEYIRRTDPHIAHIVEKLEAAESELATARRDALEQAAKVCEDASDEVNDRGYPSTELQKVAAQIRLLTVPT